MKKVIVLFVVAAGAYILLKHHKNLKDRLDNLESKDWPSINGMKDDRLENQEARGLGDKKRDENMVDHKTSDGSGNKSMGSEKTGVVDRSGDSAGKSQGRNMVQAGGGASGKSQPTRSLSSVSPQVNQFLKDYPGNWNLLRDEQGKVKSIIGGEGPRVKADNIAIVELARKMASVFEVDPNSVDGEVFFGDKSYDTQKYKVNQAVNGIPVYGGHISFVSRLSDGVVSTINSELKSVKNLDDKMMLKEAEAKVLVADLLGSKASIVTRSLGKMILSSGGVGQAAFYVWVFHARRSAKEMEVMEVLVDGRSGELAHLGVVTYR